MPRLSKDDASQLVKALRHLVDRAGECPDRRELAPILRRLSQRMEQPVRHLRTRPEGQRTDRRCEAGHVIGNHPISARRGERLQPTNPRRVT